jgi:hypothetical protein
MSPALLLFSILLVSLVLCTSLGGKNCLLETFVSKENDDLPCCDDEPKGHTSHTSHTSQTSSNANRKPKKQYNSYNKNDSSNKKGYYANYDPQFNNSGHSYPSSSTSASFIPSEESNIHAHDYSASLPTGVTRDMIPPGQESLYILKSEVVPPVCPACPMCPANTGSGKKCPPCPACARCPEPSFECKKVPNYNSKTNDYLPVPVLSNFNGFGM